MSFHRSMSSATLLGIAISAIAFADGDVRYRVVELPMPPGATSLTAYSLNNSNQVTGGASIDSDVRPFFFADGETMILDNVPGVLTSGEAINDAGHVAGTMYEYGVIWPTAFLWDGVRNQPLIDDDESHSYGQGINDLNDVVGFYEPPGGHANGDAFVCVDGEYINLGSGQASDINNKRMIVGQINRYFGQTAIWEPDGNGGWSRTVLDGLLATAINERGTMFVGGGPLSTYFDNAVVWTKQNNEWIPTAVANWNQDEVASISMDVNDREQVVGRYEKFADRERGWLWEAGNVSFLDDLLAASHSHWEILRATQINESGVILADARLQGTSDYGDPVLLIPDSLTILGPRPGVAGKRNTFITTSATPGKRIYFVYGLSKGYHTVRGCTGLKVGINAPKIIGKAKADAGGEARVSVPVAPAAKGITVYLQAVEPGSCTVSNLLPYTFR